MALFWHGMMMLKRSGLVLEPGLSYLVILPTNQKSTVGQYRGIGPGPDCGMRVEQPMSVRSLYITPRGQWTDSEQGAILARMPG